MAPGDSLTLLDRARLRVLLIFALVASGLFFAHRCHPIPSTWWFAAALTLAAAAAAARPAWMPRLSGSAVRTVCRVALMAAVVCVAAGWMQARIFERRATDLALCACLADAGEDARVLVTVEGLVLGTPRTVRPAASPLSFAFLNEPRVRVDVDVDTLADDAGNIPVSGRVWVRINLRDGPPALRAGDRVRLTGWLEAVEAPRNPGEDDLREYAAEVGYAGSLAMSSAELVEPPHAAPSAWQQVRGRALRLRAGLEDRARDLLIHAAGDDESGAARALLLGLVLGDYDPGQREVRDAFARQGLAHILSISGFHLSVLALLSLFALRLTGDRGWVEPVLVALVVLAYVAIVPASSPIVRSAAMVIGVMLAEASGRRYDRLTLLGWIAIGLLAWRPLDLWNVGFQLSLGLTAALFWLGPVFKARLWGEPIKGLVRREVHLPERALEWLKTSIATGIMCWAVAAPLVLYHFGILSPLAVAATVLITPLVVVALWGAYVVLLIGLLIPVAADLAGAVLGRLTEWSVRCVQLFDAAPLSAVRVPVVSVWWCAAATILVIYWCRWGHARQWRAWTATALAGAWLAWQCVFSSGLTRDTQLRIDILSVGNGTCHLLRSGNEAALWDCGAMPGSGAQPPLVSAVRALGAWRTPTVFITHPDLDHFGGLLEVIEPLGVRRVITDERFLQQAEVMPRGKEAYLRHELARHGITVETAAAGSRFTLGEARVDILSPPMGADWPLDNDQSLVGLWSTAGEPAALLLTGDIQDRAIAALGNGLRPRVLELPHHGSARVAAINWVTALGPEVVLQSTGTLRVDEPRWSALHEGRLWYTTHLDGAAWVEVGSRASLATGAWRGGHRRTISP